MRVSGRVSGRVSWRVSGRVSEREGEWEGELVAELVAEWAGVCVLFEFILRVTDVSGRASNLVAQMI